MIEKKLMSDMAYNTWGIFVYFFCQWVTTVIVVRLSGYNAAGIFALTISFANMFGFIGTFGVRGFQVSDVREDYSNGDYFGSRIITTAISLVPFAVLLIVRKYDAELTACCLAYMSFKCLEGFGDVNYGVMQRLKQYDWIAVSMTIKGIITLVAFILPLALGFGLLPAIICMSAAYLLSLLLYDAFKLRDSHIFKPSFANIWPLLIACFPLMLSALTSSIMMYLPRDTIGNALGSTALGYYSSISTVVVVFSTLAASVWGAITPRISIMIINRNIDKLKKILMKIASILLITSVVILLLGKIFAPFAFELLFGYEILKYMYLLIPVLINAILLMCISFFDSVFIPLKRRRELFICNFIGLVICLVAVKPLTDKYGILGANNSMILGFSVRLIFLIILTIIYLKRLEVKNYDAN